jgi:hypothetical protein
VRLWVDDLRAFERLCPDRHPPLQQWQQVLRCGGGSDWPQTEAADVVIAAFACQLPVPTWTPWPNGKAPLWMNLDYSAPRTGHRLSRLAVGEVQAVQKFFFFPVSTRGTGGLLRESGLLERRRQFQQSPAAQRFSSRLGIDRAPARN